jgi:hypothetical protein
VQRHALAPAAVAPLRGGREGHLQGVAVVVRRVLEVGVVFVRVGEGVGEGELSDGELDEGDAEGPDVGFDGVGGTLDALGL